MALAALQAPHGYSLCLQREKGDPMAYSYHNSKGTYYLHGRIVKLRNGREQQIFCFSKAPEDGLDQLPAGYAVSEVKTSGLPVLKKIAR